MRSENRIFVPNRKKIDKKGLKILMRPADIFNETKGRIAEGQRCPSAQGLPTGEKVVGPRSIGALKIFSGQGVSGGLC
jgi:hypothetical protein